MFIDECPIAFCSLVIEPVLLKISIAPECLKEYNVCPNCHAMIHSKRPAFTIEEIMEIRKTTDNN